MIDITSRAEDFADTKLLIFDVDETLVHANDPQFYAQYGEAVHDVIQQYYGVERNLAVEIANFYRQKYGGGQQALFRGDAHEHFSFLEALPPDVGLLYDELAKIEATGKFIDKTSLKNQIKIAREMGVRAACLTSSPDSLSKNILASSGFDVLEDFDLFVSYTRADGPPKMMNAEKVFDQIRSHFNVEASDVLAVGDSLSYDVLPPSRLGMKACLVSEVMPPGQHEKIYWAPDSRVVIDRLIAAKS